MEMGKVIAPPPEPHHVARPARKEAAGSGAVAVRRLRLSLSNPKIRAEGQRGGRGEALRKVTSLNVPSADLETCPICLDVLSGQELGVCVDSSGCRICLHYFHLSCLQRVEGAHCPQCRARFYRRARLPCFREASLASLSAANALSKREASAALKATLRLSSEDIDDLIEASWHDWGSGEELLGEVALQKMITSVAEFLPSDQEVSSPASSSASSSSSPQVSQRNDDSKREDGHARSGVACGCGRIHVRRGDRVRRVVAASDANDDYPEQLGSVIRVGKGQESVTVKWDRIDQVEAYTWPDPEAHHLRPASFDDVAEDVRKLKAMTVLPDGRCLSSAAAEELLRRAGFDASEEELASRAKDAEEEDLRKPLQLFHRVRLLPDKRLVQNWFDRLKPCSCNRPGCAGGVTWSSRAEKHLGREAMLLQIDNNDDTVLVETFGPCDCKVWYPRLAVTPVYDPDLDDSPEFQVDDAVECKMENGWERGIVKEVLWQGRARRGPVPYTVKLDRGGAIFVPDVKLIRRATKLLSRATL
eukprot:TRINITY_DN29367_c0_g1_i1.p1 TRINITY_DN29367_c0_g1~~TRINITY_DN29367_c0_g1_i1.p1  ORF type:complete len:581 (-),score=110.13 TRINITY_DN29367_c0_g1_i1:23-1615(-)